MKFLLEVAVARLDDALNACACGADRLELNAALELGGLTPSVGLLQEVKQAVGLPVVAMIRPRSGGFCYSAADMRVMLRDAAVLLEHGADGIAVGVLQSDRTVHRARCREFARLAAGRDLVFHRACDVVSEPERLLEELIDLGYRRVLTSGGARTAREGVARIRAWQQLAASRIEILPGAGVRPENVREILLATGAHQIHGSFRRECHDTAEPVADARYWGIAGDQMLAVRQELDCLATETG